SSGAILFNDLQAPSRARVVYRVRPITGFDPELLSSADAPLTEYAGPLPASRDSAPTPATITQEGHDRVVVDVPETASPGVLILADTWYPGWRATVNGESAAVFPVDGMFRGVVLPEEGPHRVVFRYTPQSFQAGLGLSLLSALIALGGVFATVRRKQA
ncbi:MAG: YfhO family protein, partial [Candidatus Hydrogenedentota bacterium]